MRNEEHQHDAKQETSKFKDNESWAQWYDKWKTQTVHPNLRIDFFETIDTKEKAYWLGFLYADGYLIEHPNRAEIRLKLKIKDEETINRFCDTLQLTRDKKEYLVDEGGHKQAMIRFSCRKMSDDLINHGLTIQKIKNHNLPPTSKPRLGTRLPSRVLRRRRRNTHNNNLIRKYAVSGTSKREIQTHIQDSS